MKIKNDIKQIAAFTVRNIKLFFKDKGTLIGALVAPLIIMMLYALFLHRIFLQTFDSMLEGITLPAKTVNGLVASYEVSSVLSVCCVTVAFVANMNMVADRVNGARADITVTPAKGACDCFGLLLCNSYGHARYMLHNNARRILLHSRHGLGDERRRSAVRSA